VTKPGGAVEMKQNKINKPGCGSDIIYYLRPEEIIDNGSSNAFSLAMRLIGVGVL
jgi:hypothetical protein